MVAAATYFKVNYGTTMPFITPPVFTTIASCEFLLSTLIWPALNSNTQRYIIMQISLLFEALAFPFKLRFLVILQITC